LNHSAFRRYMLRTERYCGEGSSVLFFAGRVKVSAHKQMTYTSCRIKEMHVAKKRSSQNSVINKKKK